MRRTDRKTPATRRAAALPLPQLSDWRTGASWLLYRMELADCLGEVSLAAQNHQQVELNRQKIADVYLFSMTFEVANGLQSTGRSDGGRDEEKTGDSIPSGRSRGFRTWAVFRGIRFRWLGPISVSGSVCGICATAAAGCVVCAASLSGAGLHVDWRVLLSGWSALGLAPGLLGRTSVGRRRVGSSSLERRALERRLLAAVGSDQVQGTPAAKTAGATTADRGQATACVDHK